MSKEIAKKLIAELQTNEELKTKIVGIGDRAAADTGILKITSVSTIKG